MLILARHGNTFEKDETPRMVGAREDLPLTAEGREQAQQLGRALKESGVTMDCVRAGPLSRTLAHAQIACHAAGYTADVIVDPALRELDFGAWSGLSDGQIADRFGQAAIDAWRRDGLRPGDCDWSPPESEVVRALRERATTSRGNQLWVTSNGVLRYAMELDGQAFSELRHDGGFRVSTGRICVFRRTPSGLKLLLWNERPDVLLTLRQSR